MGHDELAGDGCGQGAEASGPSEIPPPPPKLEQRKHGGNHMFLPIPNQAEREAWAAARWAVNDWTCKQIGEALDVTVPTAFRYVQAGLRASKVIAQATAEQARAAHRARLEYATDIAVAVMEREHVHVSQGRVVKDSSGVPLLDDGPKLAAAGVVKGLSESLRKLDGLDSATKIDTTITTTPQDAELAERIRVARERIAEQERRLLEGDDDA